MLRPIWRTSEGVSFLCCILAFLAVLEVVVAGHVQPGFDGMIPNVGITAGSSAGNVHQAPRKVVLHV